MKFQLPASYTEAHITAMKKAEALMKCAPDSIQRVFGGLWEWKDDRDNWRECVGGFPQRDLNAMQQVEKTLPESQRADYAHELINHFKPDFDNIHANAEQRADAILATMGMTP